MRPFLLSLINTINNTTKETLMLFLQILSGIFIFSSLSILSHMFYVRWKFKIKAATLHETANAISLTMLFACLAGIYALLNDAFATLMYVICCVIWIGNAVMCKYSYNKQMQKEKDIQNELSN